MGNFPSMITQNLKDSFFTDADRRVTGLFSWLPALIAILITILSSESAIAQDLYVGFNSSARTTNFTSGTNAYLNTYVGYNSGDSNNVLNVANPGTLLTNTGDLYVGYNGSGNSLSISNGGTVADDYGYVGGFTTNSSNTNNSALITGANSLWTNRNDFIVGNEGSGNSLVISNGGTVANATGVIGASYSSNNSALVTGANSLWTNGNDFIVGYEGSGNSLVISNGGTVANATGVIGNAFTSSNNSALVTGVGSSWSNGGPLYIAGEGGGTLTVANGGTVSAVNGITIAYAAGSVGTLNIGSLGGSDTAGTITAVTIEFGSGAGAINFNQRDATTLTSSISGAGALNQIGTGTTILTGSNIYTGTTTITNGTLLANNTAGSALGSSSVLVQSGGTLGGNGSIAGPVTIASGGNLTPGSEGIGALTLTDGLTIQSGATTTFLINSTNSFTSLNIQGGIVSYGGTMRLDLTSYASLAASGDSFALFGTWGEGATNTNNFSSLIAIGATMTFTDAGGLWSATDLTTGLNYQFSDATGQLSVTTAVPEPSTYALFGLGALALIVAYRRKVA